MYLQQKPRPQMQTALSTAEILREYQSEVDVTPGTADRYVYMIDRLWVKWMAQKRLDYRQPTENELLRYKRHLIEKGTASAYINLIISALRSYFRWLERKGYYPNIASGLKPVPRDHDFKKPPLLAPDVANIFQQINTGTIRGRRDKILIGLLFSCGLRLNEALSLDIKHVDLVRNVISIKGKGRINRQQIPIPAALAKQINGYLAERDDPNPDEPLFKAHKTDIYDEIGSPRLKRGSAYNIMKRYLVKAGYDKPGLSAHSLRHGAAVTMLQKGATLHEISMFLRHTNLNISRLYIQAAEKEVLNEKAYESQLFEMING